MPLLLRLLSSPNYTIPTEPGIRKIGYIRKLIDKGVIIDHRDSLELDIDKFRKISVVVSDELYDNFSDINWLREQRKRLGIIETEIKGEDFRRRQQARRKKRRAYAKEQRAKLKAQPPDQLPLSAIVFDESIETKLKPKAE